MYGRFGCVASETESLSLNKPRRSFPLAKKSAKLSQRSSFQHVLQRAVFHVQSSGRSEVSGANVLVAIFSEQESQAAFICCANIM